MPPRSEPAGSYRGAALLASLLVALPLLRGGVDLPVQVAALVVASLAFVLVLGGAGGRVPVPVALLGLVIAAVLVQSIPFTGLSLDAPSSGRELGKALTLWAALATACALGWARRRRDWILYALAASGIAVSCVALGVALVSGGSLSDAVAKPFVNRNHLAGFSTLTAFTILGLALRARGNGRVLLLLGFVLNGAVAFLTLSRGAIGAFLGGCALFALLALWRRGGRATHGHQWLGLGVSVAVVVGIAAFVALDPILGRLRTVQGLADEVKLALLRPAFEMIAARPVFGVGRGAFDVAFPAWNTEPSGRTFTHLENEWIQPLVELGIPAGALLVGAIAWLWVRAARRRDLTWVDIGLLSGTGALAAQNLVDFSLELVGVAGPFTVALGMVQHGDGGLRLGRSAVIGIALVGTGVGLAGFGLWSAHPVEEDAAWVAAADTPLEAEVRARDLARWHPADWVPVATVGARWVEGGSCAKAMPWLTRAMELNPTGPEPHLYAGRCLAAAGQEGHAKREYRLAYLFGRADALKEATRWWRGVADLLAVAPDTPDALIALAEVMREQGLSAERIEVLRRLRGEFKDARALVPLGIALASAGQLEEALTLARQRQAESPLAPEGWRLAAEVLVRMGRTDDADAELESGLNRCPGARPLVELQFWRAMSGRRFSHAKRIAETIAIQSPGDMAQRQLLGAEALAAQGRLGEAIASARSAAASIPDDAYPLTVVATLSEQAGRIDDAIAALEHAASIRGASDARISERLKALRDRMEKPKQTGTASPRSP